MSVDEKPREERQKVMIRARMRSGGSWSDVCLVNVSAHGLGIQTDVPPERGTYVEICRGHHMIIARVVWAKGHRAGLRSQDPICLHELLNAHKVDPSGARAAAGRPIERRRVPRTTQQRHETSRALARLMEFGIFALSAAAFATMAFGAIEHALAQPLHEIEAALQ